MVPDHLIRERDVADEHLALGRERRIPLYRHLRRYRICALLVLALFGLHLLAAGSGASKSDLLTAQQATSSHASIQTAQASEHGGPLAVGMGAGASSAGRMGTTVLAASCNPFDVICWLTNAAQWIGQQIINALQSVTSGLLHGPLDIITQTPPGDTYQNGTVITRSNAFLVVVDLALASLIVIGGYNVMVGHELGLPTRRLRSSCRACCWPSERRTLACSSWGSSSTWKMRSAGWPWIWRATRCSPTSLRASCRAICWVRVSWWWCWPSCWG